MFSGTTSLGHDFGHVYTDAKWKENVEGPFGAFAAMIFCKYAVF